MISQVRNLDGEVRRHEAERQEENAQLGKQRGIPSQPGGSLRVPLRREVEVLPNLVRLNSGEESGTLQG